jgi:hypothetical protein
MKFLNSKIRPKGKRSIQKLTGRDHWWKDISCMIRIVLAILKSVTCNCMRQNVKYSYDKTMVVLIFPKVIDGVNYIRLIIPFVQFFYLSYFLIIYWKSLLRIYFGKSKTFVMCFLYQQNFQFCLFWKRI